ncbi:MAG: hypothetical protein M1531_09500 [Chloroflexi bacterium]|nr:hypothetical protein [Chloroflexota bacterium]
MLGEPLWDMTTHLMLDALRRRVDAGDVSDWPDCREQTYLRPDVSQVPVLVFGAVSWQWPR